MPRRIFSPSRRELCETRKQAQSAIWRSEAMLRERIEGKWIDCFADSVCEMRRRCGRQRCRSVRNPISPSHRRACLSLALLRLGCRPFHLIVPSPRLSAPAPVRSTGASNALAGLAPVVNALASSVLVVDVTVEGLLHAVELPRILAGGARVLMISNEHPEALERLLPDDGARAQGACGHAHARSGQANARHLARRHRTHA